MNTKKIRKVESKVTQTKTNYNTKQTQQQQQWKERNKLSKEVSVNTQLKMETKFSNEKSNSLRVNYEIIQQLKPEQTTAKNDRKLDFGPLAKNEGNSIEDGGNRDEFRRNQTLEMKLNILRLQTLTQNLILHLRLLFSLF